MRWFSNEPVSEDVIRKILGTGGHVQSGKNIQTRQFIVMRDRETLKALS